MKNITNLYLLGALLIGATFAVATDSNEIENETNPDEILAKLWDQAGPKLEHWKTEAYLRRFMNLTSDSAEQRYIEARNDVDYFLAIANACKFNVEERCELQTSPIRTIDSSAYPQNLADHIETSKRLFEESCKNYAQRTIGQAIERISPTDLADLDSLMNRVGIRANNMNAQPPSSRLIGAGSLAYINSKVNLRDVRFAPYAGIDGTMNYAVEYNRHVISLCNTLLWNFSTVKPTLIDWLADDHEQYPTWKLWIRRRDACEIVINERDTIINDSYWALADKMRAH